MAMGIFNRKRDDGSPPHHDAGHRPSPGAPSAATVQAVRGDPDIGVPPYRPAPKETVAVNHAAAMPSVPAMPNGARSAPVATAGSRYGSRVVEPSERRTLVVGRGIGLQGTVADAERLVVEGTVESQMIQAAELFVAGSGVFKGEVEVEDAEIAGTFDGTITARGSLVIRATGRISGTARCRKLSVEEGGQVSGKMEMLNEAAALVSPARMPLPSVPADA